MTRYFFALFVIMSCISCNKKTDKDIEAEYIASFIQKITFPKEVTSIVLLPGLGCHGCIQEGEAFLKENVEHKSLFFILTNIESLKLLQHKTGIALHQHSSIYIDKDNEFILPTNHNIYPCIIQVKNGSYTDHEFQNPQNSQAFAKLETRLSPDE